jgi:hypothetical protein
MAHGVRMLLLLLLLLLLCQRTMLTGLLAVVLLLLLLLLSLELATPPAGTRAWSGMTKRGSRWPGSGA